MTMAEARNALRRAIPDGLKQARRQYEQPTDAQLNECILDCLDVLSGENRYAVEGGNGVT